MGMMVDAFIADWLIVDFEQRRTFQPLLPPALRQRRLRSKALDNIRPGGSGHEVMLRYLIEEHPQSVAARREDCHWKTSRIAHQMVAEHYGCHSLRTAKR